MNISVIHPARNEHQEIAPTVRSMLDAGADEVLVFDDGSDTPLEVQADTRHFRHETSRGPSVCRNLGALAATGDVLVFADAHTRIPDLRGIAQVALDHGVIVIPAMQSLNGSGSVTGHGRDFILKGKGNELIGFERANREPQERFMRAGGNWGGFFIMSRATYDRIGGWVDHQYWGYNDPSLILKAWLCGVDTICDSSVIYKHKGKVKGGFGYPVKALHPLLNVLHTYATCFEDTRPWMTLFEKHHKWMMKQGIEHVSTSEKAAERARFQSLRRRGDDEFFQVFLPARGFNGEVWHA